MASALQVGSALAPDGAHEARNRNLRKLRADPGAVVLDALSDPKTVEVMLNADGQLWQERLGEPLREIGAMEAWQAEVIVCAVAAILKRVVTRENPIIGGELPDGSRLADQLPPIATAPCFAIRKRASEVYTLEQYVQDAWRGCDCPPSGAAGEVQPIVIRNEVFNKKGAARVVVLALCSSFSIPGWFCSADLPW
jgi:hypothetical protein